MKPFLVLLSVVAVAPLKAGDAQPFPPVSLHLEARPAWTSDAVARESGLDINHPRIDDVGSFVVLPRGGREYLPVGPVRIDYGVPIPRDQLLDAPGSGYHWLNVPGREYRRQARDGGGNRKA
jgi:hypothetical protein